MNNNQYEYITEAINVEDMVIISDDFAIGSSYSNKSTPTGLYLFNTVLKTHESINLQDVEIKHDILNYPDATPLPDLNLMSTHGLDYDQRSHKLYVINHGHRESVEILTSPCSMENLVFPGLVALLPRRVQSWMRSHR